MPITTKFDVSETSYKAIPADVYQVVIEDIEVRVGKKYMSDEEQKQFLFRTKVLDEGEHKGHGLGFYVSIKWFAGKSAMQPSKLFNLFKAVYSNYYKSVDLLKWTGDMINMETVNDFIGKQIRVTVEEKEGKNRVTTFMPIKKEMEVQKVELSPLKNEDVDPESIPF